jgi:hypothetical protein
MRVFVSHTSRDRNLAEQIASDLRAEGCNVFTYFDAIAPGDSIAEKIATSIIESDAVIVLVSKESAQNPWVNSEIALARAQIERGVRHRILPVVIQKEAEVPFFIKDLFYLDLSDEEKYKENMPRLVRALKQTEAEGAPVDRQKTHRAREEMARAREAAMIVEERFYHEYRSIQQSFISQVMRMALLAGLSLGIVATVLTLFSTIHWTVVLAGALLFFVGMSVPIFLFYRYRRVELERLARLKHSFQDVIESLQDKGEVSK